MSCAKSKSTNGDHCRHGLAQVCCWCGEALHGPYMQGPLTTTPWIQGYTCTVCGQYVFGNTFHGCGGYKPMWTGLTIWNNPR